VELGAGLRRERHVGEHIRLGLVQEGSELRGSPRDLDLGYPAHAHGLDQVVDRSGRAAVHVGFLHDRGDGAPTR
jgi:hypothetical protein